MEVMVSSATPSEQDRVKKQRAASGSTPGESTLQRAGKAAIARTAGGADMIVLDDEEDDD